MTGANEGILPPKFTVYPTNNPIGGEVFLGGFRVDEGDMKGYEVLLKKVEFGEESNLNVEYLSFHPDGTPCLDDPLIPAMVESVVRYLIEVAVKVLR